MKKKVNIILVFTFISCLFPFLLYASDVIQGECIFVDFKKNVIVVEEFDTNFDSLHKYGLETGTYIEFDISDAKIAIYPEVGDILRMLYEIDDKTHKALLLMNVSKQDIMNQ